MRLARNQFVIVDADEDRRMRAAIPSKPAKVSKQKMMAADNGDIVVDLHMERIPGPAELYGTGATVVTIR